MEMKHERFVDTIWESGGCFGRKNTTKQMEHKNFDAIITDIQPQGIVKAIFAVLGNIDHGNDRIFNGAFVKTFAERGRKVLILDNHRTQSTGDVIAKVLGLREIGRDELPPELLIKYPEATGGAELISKFEPDKDKDAKSAAAFFRLQNGWISEWSFGYDALDYDFEPGPNKSTVRNIRTIKLYEVSPVLWGMNGATMTTDAKADDRPVWETPFPETIVEYVDAIKAETKAGAVLNRRIIEKLTNVRQAITEVLQEAGVTDAAYVEPTSDDLESVNSGPLAEAKTAPTTDVAGPQALTAPDYTNLIIEISRQRLMLSEV